MAALTIVIVVIEVNAGMRRLMAPVICREDPVGEIKRRSMAARAARGSDERSSAPEGGA